MIKTAREYQITKAQVGRFERALVAPAEDIDPALAELELEAIRSQLAELRAELEEYEDRMKPGRENERNDPLIDGGRVVERALPRLHRLKSIASELGASCATQAEREYNNGRAEGYRGAIEVLRFESVVVDEFRVRSVVSRATPEPGARRKRSSARPAGAGRSVAALAGLRRCPQPHRDEN
jgi:signal recognition particle subunit SEC65